MSQTSGLLAPANLLRWVPKRRPHPLISLAITISSTLGALAIRILILGFGNGATGAAVLFPAYMIIAIYAGWRWAMGSVIFTGALVLWLTSRRPDLSLQVWTGIIIFIVSAVLVVLLAGAVRELVIAMDEERLARVTAEGHSRESEGRFGALADSAPTLMWVTTPDRKRAFVNRAYLDYLGGTYEEALVFDWRDRLHPDDVDRIVTEQIEGEKSMEPFTLEARYRRVDGEWRWLRSISRPRQTPSGAFDGFIGIAFDVTDAKQAEEDLKRINELLAERVAAAMEDRDKAQAALMQAQKLEAVGQLTGGVAHDFNNLLTVVIGALDIIQRHPDDERRRTRMAEAAMAAARRGERLTRQLLAFARRQPLNPTLLSIDQQLEESDTLLRRAVGETFHLDMTLKAGKGMVLVDGSQLEAAVLNLLINARDAVAESGHITVATERLKLKTARGALLAGDYHVITVTDDGEGMDAATLAHVFEPFFTTKPVGKGTGLGLSQVYGFASQSGGHVEVDSAPGKGTTVRILLPVNAGEAAKPRPARTRKPRALKLKVLLVEDDADVSELVEAMLKELGHHVVSAVDARAALRIAVTEPDLNLILTDVIMPGGKNGVELAREITQIRPGLPVILSSGYTGETLAGAEAAPWPLLRKPYTLEALSAVISDTIEAQQAS